MKRQWILTGVSALLVCCLFVFVPGNVFAASPGSVYYKSAFVYMCPSGASSNDNSDLYCSWMISELYPYYADPSGDPTRIIHSKLVVFLTTSLE